MYLARTPINGQGRYVLRESVRKDGIYAFRDLFDLGTDPSDFIIYPGGNAYYIDEAVEDRLEGVGVKTDTDELDDLFWPFVKPRIQRAISSFRHRGRNHRKKTRLLPLEKKKILMRTHLFDKRRVYFLKTGRTDQRGLGRMPAKLLYWLQEKSRDEIEQQFILNEAVLKPHELKTYVYVIFNLRRFFTTILAERAPEMLDPEELDGCFIEELCRLNQSTPFWGELDHGPWLHEYLARYLIIYFDSQFPGGRYLQDELRAFINRHRTYHPPARDLRMGKKEAGKVLGLSVQDLKSLSLTALTKRYRHLALKHHPDRGGDPEVFIRITEAYQSLARAKNKPF